MPETLDLLIVADGHPANMTSIENLINKVFPELGQGFTLGIVGKAGEKLETTDPNIFRLGYLRHLANIYSFAQVCVLPDIAGEGIAIKTLEAVANEMPFSAMERAMQSFSEEDMRQANVSVCRSEAAMVEDIVTLLACPDQL